LAEEIVVVGAFWTGAGCDTVPVDLRTAVRVAAGVETVKSGPAASTAPTTKAAKTRLASERAE
jgi:hypothetical protein